MNGWTGGQYSLCRCLLGSYLALRFFLFGADIDAPAFQALQAGAILVALLFAAGVADRFFAFVLGLLWGLVAVVLLMDQAPGPVGELMPLALLALHLRTSRRPYGSWGARNRPDPRGDWSLPRSNPHLLRAFLVLSLALDLTGAFYFGTLTSGGIASTLVALPFAFHPGWIAPARVDPATPTTLFFDGACGLCHRATRLILAEEQIEGAFQFAPLQGTTFEETLSARERARLPDSLVLRSPDGTLSVRSEAAVRILVGLGGYWRWIGCVLRCVPRPLRDTAYDVIARIRKRLFATPDGLCPVLPITLARRFLP